MLSTRIKIRVQSPGATGHSFVAVISESKHTRPDAVWLIGSARACSVTAALAARALSTKSRQSPPQAGAFLVSAIISDTFRPAYLDITQRPGSVRSYGAAMDISPRGPDHPAAPCCSRCRQRQRVGSVVLESQS